MIKGLDVLKQEVEVFRQRCEDVWVPRQDIKTKVAFGQSHMFFTDPNGTRKFEPHAITQLIGVQNRIPAEYMHRLLLKSVQDAEQNFHLWEFPKGGDLLVRLLDNKAVRAVLTNKYNPVPHEYVLDEVADAFTAQTGDSYRVAAGGVDQDDMLIWVEEESVLVDSYKMSILISNGETGKRSLSARLRISKIGGKAGIQHAMLFSHKHVGDLQKLHDDLALSVRALPKYRSELLQLIAAAQGSKVNWLDEIKRLERPISKDAFKRVTEFMSSRAPQTKWEFLEALLEYTENQPAYVQDTLNIFMGGFLAA